MTTAFNLTLAQFRATRMENETAALAMYRDVYGDNGEKPIVYLLGRNEAFTDCPLLLFMYDRPHQQIGRFHVDAWGDEQAFKTREEAEVFLWCAARIELRTASPKHRRRPPMTTLLDLEWDD